MGIHYVAVWWGPYLGKGFPPEIGQQALYLMTKFNVAKSGFDF